MTNIPASIAHLSRKAHLGVKLSVALMVKPLDANWKMRKSSTIEKQIMANWIPR